MRLCEFCGGSVNAATNTCAGCGAAQSTAPPPPPAHAPPPQAYGAPAQHHVGPGGQPVSDKQWIVALILNFFLGYLGLHRFYTGHIGIGVIQLLTWGGCGLWWLLDFIMLLTGSYKDSNNLPLKK